MSEPNEAHIQTEERLKKLEERIAEVYREAYEAKSKSVEAYFAELERADEKNKALLEQGKISAKKYKQWRQEEYFKGELYKKMRDELAERMTHANEIAIAYVNDETPSIYSINRNWSSYKIESQVGDCNFTLFNEQAVKRLIVEDPSLMPNYPAEKAVKRGIDLAYGKKQITASITSGILQGESVPEIAKNLQSRITDMNYKSAVRAARTSVIGAENAGTLDSLIAAAKMGINVRKLWISTLDGRTRHSHAVLDGETAELTKAFSNGLMYPGDPNGRPEEVYNCRCTIAGDIPDEPDEPNTERRARSTATGKNYIIEDMTYQEWIERKSNSVNDDTSHKTKSQKVFDVTEEYIKSKKITGNIRYEDGYEKNTHTAEVETAEILRTTFGGDIVLLKELNEQGKKTPDYLWNKKKWEQKTISTAKAADSALRGALKQIQDNSGGVVFTCSADIEYEDLVKVLDSRSLRGNTANFDVVTIRSGEFWFARRYKK